jgi:hypothetical protein
MMIIYRTCVMLSMFMLLTPTAAMAQAYEKNLQARLPTVRQVLQKGAMLPFLDTYNLQRYRLRCELPNGESVGVVLVNDSENFSFLAVRSHFRPAILANEGYIAGKNQPYAIFSFYRECGVHAMQGDKAGDIGDGHQYDKAVIQNAECLAVIPTRNTLGKNIPFPFESIAEQLLQEYGNRGTSTATMLKECNDQGQVQKRASRW